MKTLTTVLGSTQTRNRQQRHKLVAQLVLIFAASLMVAATSMGTAAAAHEHTATQHSNQQHSDWWHRGFRHSGFWHHGPKHAGAVYVLSNQQRANKVIVYARTKDGKLTLFHSYWTFGRGAGSGADPLGSQNSLVLAHHGHLLFAVNAGSDSISEFAVRGLRLRLLDIVPCTVGCL